PARLDELRELRDRGGRRVDPERRDVDPVWWPLVVVRLCFVLVAQRDVEASAQLDALWLAHFGEQRAALQTAIAEGRYDLDVLRVLQLVLRDVSHQEVRRKTGKGRRRARLQSLTHTAEHLREESAQIVRCRELDARRF